MLNFFIIFFVDYTCYSSKYYIQISDNDTLELGGEIKICKEHIDLLAVVRF